MSLIIGSKCLNKASLHLACKRFFAHKAAESSTASERKEKKEKSTKSPSAYNIFYKEHYQRFKEEGGDTTLGAITKKVAQVWKDLSNEQKMPYLEKSQKLKAEYIPIEKESKKASKKVGSKKVVPQKAPSAYANFVTLQYKAIKEQDSRRAPQEIIRIIAEQWKQLSEEQKEQYKLDTQQNMDDQKL
eukprot:TRINITY_DN6862_c0_g1_i5.p3 TRINITY_DN6862_c0_g1~~TRINITY_DN6862_c0_g1_i5.p3  ORF type:complete len:187 (+),score=14.98 TRINITY_DN6862_c0_g1_i5:142-702(+)